MKMPQVAPHCEYCGRLLWGRHDICNCDKRPTLRRKLAGWFDVNADGEVTIEDLSIIAVGHHWMLIGGLFIFIGAVGNVMGWWTINSDAFWAAAGLAAIMEYRDDIKRGRRQ